MRFGKLALAGLLCLACTSTAHAQVTINYPDFSSLSGLTLNGAAATINASGPVTFNGQSVLRLTNDFGQGSSAFVTNPISLTGPGGFLASFSSMFSFQLSNSRGIGDEDGAGADGIVFVVQTNASNVGGFGGGIGYAGIPQSVGIEFDTFNNGGGDGNNGNHVGIDVNGDTNSVILKAADTGVNGSTRFNNGEVFYAWVDYDGTSQDLEVRYSNVAVRPATPFLSYTINLPSILMSPNAFVGFTAGTGSGANDQDIRSFAFTNTFQPFGVVPEPGNVALLAGMSISGAGFLVRRRKYASK